MNETKKMRKKNESIIEEKKIRIKNLRKTMVGMNKKGNGKNEQK